VPEAEIRGQRRGTALQRLRLIAAGKRTHAAWHQAVVGSGDMALTRTSALQGTAAVEPSRDCSHQCPLYYRSNQPPGPVADSLSKHEDIHNIKWRYTSARGRVTSKWATTTRGRRSMVRPSATKPTAR
jgi:hypothetical protein